MVRRCAAGQVRGAVDDRRRLSAGVRPGHRRRRPVVDRLDEGRSSRKAIAAAGAIAVVTEHGPAFVAAGDVEPDDADTRRGWPCSPGSTPRRWVGSGASWYVADELAASVFDRSGNAGPTIWVDGRVVGAWAQRADGTIATWLTSSISQIHERMLDDEIERLQRLVGDVRFRRALPVAAESPAGRSVADELAEPPDADQLDPLATRVDRGVVGGRGRR